jgi:hypothetical protein
MRKESLTVISSWNMSDASALCVVTTFASKAGEDRRLQAPCLDHVIHSMYSFIHGTYADEKPWRINRSRCHVRTARFFVMQKRSKKQTMALRSLPPIFREVLPSQKPKYSIFHCGLNSWGSSGHELSHHFTRRCDR